MRDAPEVPTRRRGGKFLTFVLQDELYGLEILRVREIIGMPHITRVPHTPDFISGVTNIRGKVISVIDLRLRLGLERAVQTERTCVIVVDVGDEQTGSIELGVVVDQVSEVLSIAEADMADAPAFGVDIEAEFILGMGKTGERVTILLDIARVLTRSEAQAARSVGERAPGQSGAEKRKGEPA